MHAPKSHQLRPPSQLLRGSVSTKVDTVRRRLLSWCHLRLVDCRPSACVVKKPYAKERTQRDQDLYCAPRRCFNQGNLCCNCLWCFEASKRQTQCVNRALRCSVVFCDVPSLYKQNCIQQFFTHRSEIRLRPRSKFPSSQKKKRSPRDKALAYFF